MKTNMHPNSLDAYTDLIESGDVTKGQTKVLDVLRYTHNITREQIARLAEMKESSVCGRVNELIEKSIVVPTGTTKTLSGKTADTLALAPKYKH